MLVIAYLGKCHHCELGKSFRRMISSFPSLIAYIISGHAQFTALELD